jgi:hypothetical protein
MTTARKYETVLADWLRKAIDEKGVEILDGQVTAEHYERRKAYRQALKDVLGKLPEIAKKADD